MPLSIENKANTERFIELRKKILETEFCSLNDKQREAVFTTQGPLLILAGAGSGKTTVLVNRIYYILKYGDAYRSGFIPEDLGEEDIAYLQGCLKEKNFSDKRLSQLLRAGSVPPWSILAITFTNKAANEMKERLSSMLGEKSDEIWACTFHSACARILRRDIDKLGAGYDRSFAIYDTDDSLKVIRECSREIIDEKALSPKAVFSVISKAKEKCVDPKAFAQTAGGDFRLQKIAKAYEKYQKTMKAANALDFDDMLCLTVQLFEQVPEVLEQYRRRFKYILVDEYQDTNPVQYKFVSLLAGLHENLCVVGDDDQSIYSFRGATIENILSFEKQFRGAKTIKLEQNYRSTSTILNSANAVIENNTARKGKQLWTQNEDGEKITVCRFDDEAGESQFIANSILEDVKNGESFSKHAVLYRMNAQSGSIEKAFVRCGIPYRIIGGFRFYERQEVKDIMAYLCVLNNPRDGVRLRRIINTPKRSIGAATVDAAVQIAEEQGLSLFEVLKNCAAYPYFAKKVQRIEEFVKFMESAAEHVDKVPLQELIRSVIIGSGYLGALQADGSKEAKERIENLNNLVSSAAQYEKESDEPSLEGYLEEAALMTDIDNYDENADNVVLMTMHSAKGLEFPVVFIAGMEEGVFPNQNCAYKPEELEEERRLAYVGITRAKKKLFLTYANTRMLFGSTVYNRESRFIGEIPEEYRDEKQRPRPFREKIPQAAAAKAKTADVVKLGISQSGKKSGVRFSSGDIVNHNTFGRGIILSVKPMGGDQLLEIAFDRSGTKKVMANYAKISICH